MHAHAVHSNESQIRATKYKAEQTETSSSHCNKCTRVVGNAIEIRGMLTMMSTGLAEHIFQKTIVKHDEIMM